MNRSNTGTAVIIAMLTVLILSTLGASIMFTTQAEVTTTYNLKRLTQARYAAEAGAQSTVNWIIYNYPFPADYSGFDVTQSPVRYNGQPVVFSASGNVTANYPFAADQAAFSNVLLNKLVPGMDVSISYATTATLQTMHVVTPLAGTTQVPLQSWVISSRSTLGGSMAQVDVSTSIEKFGSPVFSYAAFAVSSSCGAVTFSGGTATDSFDSSLGTYAATKQNSSGNVGTNGNISLNGNNTTINGTGSTPFAAAGNCGAVMTSLTATNGATVSAGMVTLSSQVAFAAPAAPAPAPPTGNQNANGACNGIAGCSALGGNNLGFAPGQYADLSIGGGTSVHLSQGVYNINSLSLSGNSTLIIDSGPVVLNVAGAGLAGNNAAIDLTGGTVSNTVTGKASDLQILYAGVQPVKIPGGASSYGVVYTPNAPVTLTGGSNWYGSIIGNTVTDTGGTTIHYDRSLNNNLYIIGNYHTTSFGWSKY